MRLSYDLPSRAARLLFTLTLVVAWTRYPAGAADPPAADPATPAAPPPRDPAGDLKRLCASITAADRDLPKDSFDPEAVVGKVGRDPDKLFAWVRDRTAWVPYQGTLR